MLRTWSDTTDDFPGTTATATATSPRPAGDSWIHDVRQAVRDADTDYFRVSPFRYWADFLVSLVLAYLAVVIYLVSPLGSWQQLVAFPIATFWLYRMGSLVHEVCHLGEHEMPGFKAAWNILGGIVILMPSPFFTRHHRDHHSQRFYGTPQDPEYVANMVEAGNAASVVGYALKVMAMPILVFLRFLLVPLTFVHPHPRVDAPPCIGADVQPPVRATAHRRRPAGDPGRGDSLLLPRDADPAAGDPRPQPVDANPVALRVGRGHRGPQPPPFPGRPPLRG